MAYLCTQNTISEVTNPGGTCSDMMQDLRRPVLKRWLILSMTSRERLICRAWTALCRPLCQYKRRRSGQSVHLCWLALEGWAPHRKHIIIAEAKNKLTTTRWLDDDLAAAASQTERTFALTIYINNNNNNTAGSRIIQSELRPTLIVHARTAASIISTSTHARKHTHTRTPTSSSGHARAHAHAFLRPKKKTNFFPWSRGQKSNAEVQQTTCINDCNDPHAAATVRAFPNG